MTTDTVRLHISPFAPESASSIIPTALSTKAENISFHSIQTFPEKSFGYVDLPRMEAEKLKKKLNGSILKGKKIRVEEARPRHRSLQELDGEPSLLSETTPDRSQKPKSSNDGKHEQTINGYQMPESRKVKRGWTEPRRKERKKSTTSGKAEPPPSKYSDKSECLFRSQLPPNKTDQKDSSAGKEKKKKDSKPKDQVLVHEFQKSTNFPTFLRSNTEDAGATPAAEFVEGKGWIDVNGKVVEQAPEPSSRPLSQAETSNSKKRKAVVTEEPLSDSTSSSDESLDQAGTKRKLPMSVNQPADDDDETSSSGTESTSSSGSDSDSDSDGDSEADSQSGSEESTSTASPPQISQTTNTSLSRTSPDAAKIAPHPLEALFKRPPPPSQQSKSSQSSIPKPSLEISTSFSFFDPDVQDAEEEGYKEPLTPFSSQDRTFRRIRSAAPTPDTAAPSRTSYFPEGSEPELASEDSDDSKDSDDDMATPVRASQTASSKARHPQDASLEGTGEDDGAVDPGVLDPISPSSLSQQPGGPQQEQSDFVKWFYAHRGENNRLWKRRRREAAKEKRREENRKDAKRARRR